MARRTCGRGRWRVGGARQRWGSPGRPPIMQWPCSCRAACRPRRGSTAQASTAQAPTPGRHPKPPPHLLLRQPPARRDAAHHLRAQAGQPVAQRLALGAGGSAVPQEVGGALVLLRRWRRRGGGAGGARCWAHGGGRHPSAAGWRMQVRRGPHSHLPRHLVGSPTSRAKKTGTMRQRSSRPRAKGVAAARPVTDTRPPGCTATTSKAEAR